MEKVIAMAYEDILGPRKEDKVISVMIRCDKCNKAFQALINGSQFQVCPWCTHKNKMFKGESPTRFDNEGQENP